MAPAAGDAVGAPIASHPPAVTGSTCPSSLLRDSQNHLVDFDFDGKTAGAQNDSLVVGGKSKTAGHCATLYRSGCWVANLVSSHSSL